eukprot:UN10416
MNGDLGGLSELIMRYQQANTVVVSYLHPLFYYFVELFEDVLIQEVYDDAGQYIASGPLHFYVLPSELTGRTNRETLNLDKGWVDMIPLTTNPDPT